MAVVRLRGEARFFHDGQLIVRGRVFMASERDAADLVALRFATRLPNEEVQRADLQVETPGTDSSVVDAWEEKPVRPPRVRRKYKRRDMQAEGED